MDYKELTKIANAHSDALASSTAVDHFDRVSHVTNNGKWLKHPLRVFSQDKGYNLVDAKGNLLSDIWFKSLNDAFEYGLSGVYLNRKSNCIRLDGTLLSNEWFDSTYVDPHGYVLVSKDDKENCLKLDGTLVSDIWFDYIVGTFDSSLLVRLRDKGYNFIDTNGQLIGDQWYQGIDNFHEGFAAVTSNGKYNFVDNKGHLLSDTWFDGITFFRSDKIASVEIGSTWHKIDTSGKLLN